MSSWSSETFAADRGKAVLLEMWHDRHQADFELRCGSKAFKVHKAVLRAHSDVLARVCDNRSFKVSSTRQLYSSLTVLMLTHIQEALTGVLNLKEQPYEGKIQNLGDGDDPEIVEEMIYFFYHLKLSFRVAGYDEDDWSSYDDVSKPSLVYLARIYVLAGKYFIEGLKAKTMFHIRRILADELNHPELAEACHIIYTKTVEPGGERGLKTAVAESLALGLRKGKTFEEHHKMFQEIPELAVRVLQAIPELANHSQSCEYPDCGPQ